MCHRCTIGAANPVLIKQTLEYDPCVAIVEKVQIRHKGINTDPRFSIVTKTAFCLKLSEIESVLCQKVNVGVCALHHCSQSIRMNSGNLDWTVSTHWACSSLMFDVTMNGN